MTNRGSSGINCICSLFCLIFTLIVALIVIIGLAILIFWLIFHPTSPKFLVTDATLTEFSLVNNTPKYNLMLNLTVCNPNKRVGVYYKEIKTLAYYEGHWFSNVTFKSFYQGHKNTTVLSPVFQGVSDFYKVSVKNVTGVYNIALRVHPSFELWFGKLKTGTLMLKFECYLKVHLNGNGFETTKCSPEK